MRKSFPNSRVVLYFIRNHFVAHTVIGDKLDKRCLIGSLGMLECFNQIRYFFTEFQTGYTLNNVLVRRITQFIVTCMWVSYTQNIPLGPTVTGLVFQVLVCDLIWSFL